MNSLKDEHPSYWEYNALEKITIFLNREDTDINQRLDRSHWTMLHGYASYNNDPKVIKKLLDSGADVNVRDTDGLSPLHLAASNNEKLDVIKLLLNKDANVNVRDVNGCTPLHFAARNNKNPDVITALLEKGADGKARDINGNIPFQYAHGNQYIKDTDAYWRLNDAYWELKQQEITVYTPPPNPDQT